MKTIFFDVDTQLDFLFPGGALYVPGADEIAGALSVLTRFAASNQIQIVSTADAHAEDDPEFKTWKPHCVLGTVGQQKASGTLAAQPLILSTAHNGLDELRDRARAAAQIVIEKQKLDCFTNPNLQPLLEFLGAQRYVVYGVVTELCVQCAATGLLQLGARVEIVTDAIKSLSARAEQEFFRSFQRAGGTLTTVAALTG